MVVTDPVMIVIAAACARSMTRLVEALAQRIVLWAKIALIRAAASAPPGIDIIEQDHRGRSWRIRSDRHR